MIVLVEPLVFHLQFFGGFLNKLVLQTLVCCQWKKIQIKTASKNVCLTVGNASC
jgi:hypothetical protein